jgi:hypothetical protein
MRSLMQAAIAAISLTSSFGTAMAAQPVFVTPPGTPLLPALLYEIDYATTGRLAGSTGAGMVDTIVSIGLPAKSTGAKCNIQVAWFDWNGVLAGVSGPNGGLPLTPGVTLEFTTSTTGVQAEYPPFFENIFSDIKSPFEGYAQIRSDASCPAPQKLRVDAEFVTFTVPPTGANIGTVNYKPITVTNPKGVTGY